jgi:lipopolysaccharide/colanic/teichoic acid biosynthesis glycosyltransferase
MGLLMPWRWRCTQRRLSRVLIHMRQQDALPDAERLTPIGRFILANWTSRRNCGMYCAVTWAVRGPLLMTYLDREPPKQARHNEVRPGITGWAQPNGRNALGSAVGFGADGM